jgi:hypothetical protein
MRHPPFITSIVVAMFLGACAPQQPSQSAPVILPTFVQQTDAATAELNEAYPTSQASEAEASQSVSGFSINLRRAWRDGKQVNAEVCFSLPDTSDWTIWEAHFEYSGTSVSEFSTAFLGSQEPQGEVPAQRCDQLSFYVPPDADLSAASLTVEAVGAYPSADEYCTVYMPKIQQALIDRGANITVDCPTVDGTMSLQIVGKPDDMSQEQAEQMVFNEEFYTVRGPWSFPVTFDQ